MIAVLPHAVQRSTSKQFWLNFGHSPPLHMQYSMCFIPTTIWFKLVWG